MTFRSQVVCWLVPRDCTSDWPLQLWIRTLRNSSDRIGRSREFRPKAFRRQHSVCLRGQVQSTIRTS